MRKLFAFTRCSRSSNVRVADEKETQVCTHSNIGKLHEPNLHDELGWFRTEKTEVNSPPYLQFLYELFSPCQVKRHDITIISL